MMIARMIRPFLKSLYYGTFILALAWALYHFVPINWRETYRVAQSAPLIYPLSIMLLLFVNFLSATWRLQGAYKQFGVHLDFSTAFKTTLMGQISSLLFIPLIGAMMGQKTTLKDRQVPNAIIAVVHIYERVLLALSGILVSAGGVCFYFRGYLEHIIPVQKHLGELIIVMGLALMGVIFRGLTSYEKEIFQNAFRWSSVRQTLRVFCNTLMTWAIMSSTYVLGLKFLGVKVPLAALYSAALLTCFIASLPLSVNGWGLREFAAVLFFGYVHVSPEQALFVSMSIGVLSFLMPLALVSLKRFLPHERVVLDKNISLPSLDRIEQKLIMFIAYGAAFFIFFQVHMTLQEATININFADVFALCGLFVVGADYLFLGKKIHFKQPLIPYLLVGSLGILTLSLVTGFLSFGFSKWAFFSKYLGWVVIMGYLATGALFANVRPIQGVNRLLDVMFLTLSISLVMKLLLYFCVPIFHVESYKLPYNFEGYAGNRNALSFQLLCMVGFLFVRLPTQQFDAKKQTVWLSSFLLAVACMTLSRSGILTGGVLLITFIILQRWTIQQICYYLGCTLKIGLGVYLLRRPEVLNIFSDLLGLPALSDRSPFNASQATIADHERLYTIFSGLKLWLQAPLFGKGLGYFMHMEQLAQGVPLVIHNTYVWLLAEFGLVGFGFFGFFATYVFNQAGSKVWAAFKRKMPLPLQEGGIVSLLLIAGIMGMAHEILYQRILWFLLGLVMVQSVVTLKKDAEHPDTPKLLR